MSRPDPVPQPAAPESGPHQSGTSASGSSASGSTASVSPPCASAVSAEVPDWSRERPEFFFDTPRKLLAAIRQYQRHRASPTLLSPILRRVAVIRHRCWTLLSGTDIPLTAQIGGGLIMPHPNGIVISDETVLGPNCLLFQQVTLGTGGPIPGSPTLGGHVDVGAGAKILGGVRIGDHCRIGANAVVLSDIPSGATAVGIPARVVGIKPRLVAHPASRAEGA